MDMTPNPSTPTICVADLPPPLRSRFESLLTDHGYAIGSAVQEPPTSSISLSYVATDEEAAAFRADDAPDVVFVLTTIDKRGHRQALLDHGAGGVMRVSQDDREFMLRIRALIAKMQPVHILVLEDDDRVWEMVRSALEDAQFQTTRATEIQQAEALLEKRPFDALVLDRMLPDGDGLNLLRRLRARSLHVPSLMLTALADPRERVSGLAAGANDYVCKPFDNDELVARLKILLSARENDQVLVFGGLEIHVRNRFAFWQKNLVDLTQREISLLIYLAERAGLEVPRSMLLEDVFDIRDPSLETKVVEASIRRLRIKLAEVGMPPVIQTGKSGYFFDFEPLLVHNNR